MFGVVLWSDSQQHKAVFWCEDQGDLAFYRQSDQDVDVLLDAGDWVQFDVTTERHLRFAHNPRLVAEGVFSGLVDTLTGAGRPRAQRGGAPQFNRGSADIVPFKPQRGRSGAHNAKSADSRLV